jgi:hypothetical protein
MVYLRSSVQPSPGPVQPVWLGSALGISPYDAAACYQIAHRGGDKHGHLPESGIISSTTPPSDFVSHCVKRILRDVHDGTPRTPRVPQKTTRPYWSRKTPDGRDRFIEHAGLMPRRSPISCLLSPAWRVTVQLFFSSSSNDSTLTLRRCHPCGLSERRLSRC